MRNSEIKEAEAARLAELLCKDSTSHMGQEQLEQMSNQEVQDLCTNILSNGHTILHMLAQRQKLNSLRAVLKRGVDVFTRNGHGATPLLVALQHNALYSAKVLIDHGANVHEIVSRRKGTSLLHLMVACDRPHAVMLLLEEGANANVRDGEGRTPFHLAAIYGNTVITAVLIRHEQCEVNAVDRTGHTALMLAILNNNQELARQLVDAPRVDPVLKDRDSMASLHLAVAHGQLEVVRALLRRNTAHINGKERCMGRTPMHFACTLTCDKEGVVGSFFPHKESEGEGGEGEQKDEEDGGDSEGFEVVDAPVRKMCVAGNESPFLESEVKQALNGARRSSVDGREHKLSSGPLSVIFSQSISAEESSGNAFFEAVTTPGDKQPPVNGEPRQSVSSTRTAGPATPRDSPRSVTPRSVASPRTTTPRQQFVKGVGTVRKPTGVRLTPQMRSKTTTDLYGSGSKLYRDRYSTAGEHLLSPRTQFIATPNHKTSTYAADGGRVHKISTFRHNRPSTAPAPNQRLQGLFSLNHPWYKIPTVSNGRESAASHRSRDSAVLMVTPLNVAIIRCRLVSLLLEHGADANLMTNFRKSPLHLVAAMGQADVMSLLLPHVTNPNVLSASNKTALHLAAEGGHTAVVQQLIHAGANLALRDIHGMTALHLAAALGHADIVALLLRARADKNSCDFAQRMPLHHASLYGHKDVIDILVRAGARQDRVDNEGYLPLQYLTRKTVSMSDTVTRLSSAMSTSITEEDIDSDALSKCVPTTPSCATTTSATTNDMTETTATTTSSGTSTEELSTSKTSSTAPWRTASERSNTNTNATTTPQLPPASTAEDYTLLRVAAANSNSSARGAEAMKMADQLMASKSPRNDANGSAHSDLLNVGQAARRRKTGVFQTFAETTAVQAVSGSNPRPKVIYSGIPQTS